MATMTLDELVRQLRLSFGDDLRSVVLYGSAAVGEDIPRRSDLNVLVIVERLGLEQLRAATATARAWAETGSPPPLIMTTHEWATSVDIFPMEYADILERHRVLHGAPPFEGITVARADLRWQLEQEAMGKLLQLRRAIMATGAEPRRQRELLEESLGPLLVLFRSTLRLLGHVPPAGRDAVIQAVADRTGLDPSPFLRVARHVRREDTIPVAEAGTVLAGYLEGLGALVRWLDRHEPRHPTGASRE